MRRVSGGVPGTISRHTATTKQKALNSTSSDPVVMIMHPGTMFEQFPGADAARERRETRADPGHRASAGSDR